jgi:hypothetical protein
MFLVSDRDTLGVVTSSVILAMRPRLAIGLLLLVVWPACGAPIAPSNDIVETLSGTVQPGGSDIT